MAQKYCFMCRKEVIEVAKNLLAEGSTKIEVIAKATKLPLDEVKNLAKEINHAAG